MKLRASALVLLLTVGVVLAQAPSRPASKDKAPFMRNSRRLPGRRLLAGIRSKRIPMS